MTLKEFIKNNENRANYYYFEKETTNPEELEKLTDTEMIYLENDFFIYKTNHMDYDYQIFTYIFDDDNLHLKITKRCDTKEITHLFHQNGKISKEIFYFYDVKTGMIIYDNKGRVILNIDFEKMTGLKYEYPIDTIQPILKKSKDSELENRKKPNKQKLDLREIEEYL